MFEECLKLAKEIQCDFFTSLDNLENQEAFGPLQFFPDRDNRVLYHLFNVQCDLLKPSDVGAVFW